MVIILVLFPFRPFSVLLMDGGGEEVIPVTEKKSFFSIDVALLRLNGLMTIWTVTSTSTRFQVQFFTSLPLFSAQYAQNNGRELWAIYPDDGINLRKM